MRTVTIGDVEVIPLHDAVLTVDPRQFFVNAGANFHDQYPGALDPDGRLSLPITSFAIRSNGKVILVDTGIGGRARGPMQPGQLDKALADAGIKPEDVDVVAHTHLHIDHVGWNTVPGDNGSPRVFFPNATFMIQQQEWDYWMTDENLAAPQNAHLVECVKPVADAGQLKLVNGAEAIDENVSFVPTPGHTPGHTCIGIKSGEAQAIVTGDLSHHPAQLDHPEWAMMADADAKAASKTRDDLFNAAGEDKRTIFAGHWPDAGIGHIQAVYGQRKFRPLH